MYWSLLHFVSRFINQTTVKWATQCRVTECWTDHNMNRCSGGFCRIPLFQLPQLQQLLQVYRPSDVRRSVSARYNDRSVSAFSQPRPSLDAFERFVSSSRQFTPHVASVKVNNLREKRTIRSSVGKSWYFNFKFSGTRPRPQPLSSSLNFGRGSRQYTDVLPLYRSSNDSTLRSYMKQQRPISKRSVGKLIDWLIDW